MKNNDRKHSKNAFTFFEFLIVITIVGVLAAIAIPTYGDYVIRSKTSKMLKDIRPLQEAIANYKAINNKFVAITNDEDFQEVYGIKNPEESEVIDKAEIKVLSENKVQIFILGTGNNLSMKEGQSLQLNLTGTWTQDEGVEWICSAKGQVRYAPKECQEKNDDKSEKKVTEPKKEENEKKNTKSEYSTDSTAPEVIAAG